MYGIACIPSLMFYPPQLRVPPVILEIPQCPPPNKAKFEILQPPVSIEGETGVHTI